MFDCMMHMMQVRSHPIANQVWDQQFYLGSLVAWSKKYLAYALKGNFLLRISLSDTEAYLKGFPGCSQTPSFWLFVT